MDFIGPDFQAVDKRCVALRLVEKGLCDAALFSPSGERCGAALRAVSAAAAFANNGHWLSTCLVQHRLNGALCIVVECHGVYYGCFCIGTADVPGNFLTRNDKKSMSKLWRRSSHVCAVKPRNTSGILVCRETGDPTGSPVQEERADHPGQIPPIHSVT